LEKTSEEQKAKERRQISKLHWTLEQREIEEKKEREREKERERDRDKGRSRREREERLIIIQLFFL